MNKLKIGEIRLGMSNISLKGKIIDISEVREVRTKYGRRRVADAIIKDESGEINLSLWESQIDLVEVGDIVEISGAFVTQFRDRLQLSVPRSGKIEVVEKI